VFDEAMTMLLAGTETSANVLGWTCYLLGAHPEVQARVAGEVDEVLAGRPAGSEDLPRLDLTRRVLTEAMRLYPPVWLLTRRPVTDVEIGGQRISAGSHVFFCPYAVHRDPAVYAEPDRFDPDRWGSDASRRGSHTTFMPFGAGLRSCIGEGFAWTEMLIIMSTILARWTLHPIADRPVRPAAIGSLHPTSLSMRLQGRTHSRQETA
jgi:cytochrome P450